MAITFSELYNYCQTLQPRVSRASLNKEILQKRGSVPKVIKTSMDTSVSRGFFISLKNLEAEQAQFYGKDTIVLARELNYCWQRFVYTKELMHIFDTPQECVNSAESLGNLLNSFEVPSALNHNEPYKSESIAMWRALCCLCPEKNRQNFLEMHKKGHIDTYGVALQLRIPEQYVPHLFVSNFLDILEKIK